MSEYISRPFVNYAHRGASEYLPENTFISFYTGVFMKANGIETDVRLTKDGVPVLFHDDTLERVTGESGAVEDYTFAELQKFRVSKNGYVDTIASFEDFLRHFGFRDLTFAIELKGKGAEIVTADLLRKYNMTDKCVVTSFQMDYLETFADYAPEFKIGLLTANPDTAHELAAMGAWEICPIASLVTPESVNKWHSMGLGVRAWGVSDEKLMKQVYDSGADGMTVNFPDKLTEYIQR